MEIVSHRIVLMERCLLIDPKKRPSGGGPEGLYRRSIISVASIGHGLIRQPQL